MLIYYISISCYIMIVDDWVLSDPCNNQTMRVSAQYIVSRDSTDSSIASGMTEILCHLFADGRVSFGRLVAVCHPKIILYIYPYLRPKYAQSHSLID